MGVGGSMGDGVSAVGARPASVSVTARAAELGGSGGNGGAGECVAMLVGGAPVPGAPHAVCTCWMSGC